MVIKKYNEEWNTFQDYLNINEAPDDSNSTSKVKFDTDNYEVIGLPSGQVIYLNIYQIKYFKARNMVLFLKTWKKPIDNIYVRMDINSYCFDDKNYDDIMELIDSITW